MKILLLFLLVSLAGLFPTPSRSGTVDAPLRIALYNSGQPLFWTTGDGRPAGVFVDIWKLWAQKPGRKIQFLPSN